MDVRSNSLGFSSIGGKYEKFRLNSHFFGIGRFFILHFPKFSKATNYKFFR